MALRSCLITFGAVLLSVLHSGCGGNSAPPIGTPKPSGTDAKASIDGDIVTVVLAGQPFHLELAATRAVQDKGLGDRKEIAPDGGMLFVFPMMTDPNRCVFLMRKCLVPLDVVFLDSYARVINIEEMKVEPYDRPEAELAKYRGKSWFSFAMELPGGTARRLGLKPDDSIGLSEAQLLQLKKRVEQPDKKSGGVAP